MLYERVESNQDFIGDEGDDFVNYGGGYVVSYENDPRRLCRLDALCSTGRELRAWFYSVCDEDLLSSNFLLNLCQQGSSFR